MQNAECKFPDPFRIQHFAFTFCIQHFAFSIPMVAPPRPSHLGLRHLALNARNLEAMRRFYVDLLGFAVEWEPDPDNVYLSSGIDNLALHRSTSLTASRASDGPQSASPLDHFGVIVKRAEDVDRWA